jgi:hypothetical protein
MNSRRFIDPIASAASTNFEAAYRIAEDRVSASLHCKISSLLTAASGQQLALPHRNIGGRFTPMSGHTLSLPLGTDIANSILPI